MTELIPESNGSSGLDDFDWLEQMNARFDETERLIRRCRAVIIAVAAVGFLGLHLIEFL